MPGENTTTPQGEINAREIEFEELLRRAAAVPRPVGSELQPGVADRSRQPN